jgi:hypothetical protein
MTAPTPPPCDSPHVLTRNNTPKIEDISENQNNSKHKPVASYDRRESGDTDALPRALGVYFDVRRQTLVGIALLRVRPLNVLFHSFA